MFLFAYVQNVLLAAGCIAGKYGVFTLSYLMPFLFLLFLLNRPAGLLDWPWSELASVQYTIFWIFWLDGWLTLVGLVSKLANLSELGLTKFVPIFLKFENYILTTMHYKNIILEGKWPNLFGVLMIQLWIRQKNNSALYPQFYNVLVMIRSLFLAYHIYGLMIRIFC